jgi:ribosomal-protein-alanine N-acetyltransferase
MRGAFRIALATPRDSGAIARLLEHADSRFDVEAELARRHARLWVAGVEESGDVAGFLLAWHVADELELLDLVVDPALRRRGAGRALVAELCAYAREQRARLVALEVRKSNQAAIALYRGFEFAPSGERKRYYSDGEDALEMRLDLRY